MVNKAKKMMLGFKLMDIEKPEFKAFLDHTVTNCNAENYKTTK